MHPRPKIPLLANLAAATALVFVGPIQGHLTQGMLLEEFTSLIQGGGFYFGKNPQGSQNFVSQGLAALLNPNDSKNVFARLGPDTTAGASFL